MVSKTTVELNVTSGTSLDKETAKAEKLRAVLLEAAQALKSAAGSAPRVSAARASTERVAERGATGLARSIGEDSGTGSGARDFARQASGLGGLVRLYATFAANIFAATAAFGALSRAMDTSNLIKGLDQLGASAGRNLGGLSKEFVRATDGAISLRDAATAVAKASSSGLGKENILRVAEVAKTASQALGVDMADAVSRLTRGITKLEPELLDELGIFTRVDKAVQDYAKSVGKSTLALTDFERRQAFANAVLAEGEAKFSAIKLDSNPYTKLSATFQDVIFKGLELVNTVLAPIAEILSRSPIALAGALALIAGSLFKQAVPAVTSWKQGLDEAAESARNAVVEANKLRRVRSDEIGSEIYTKTLTSTKLAEDAITKLQKSRFKSAAEATKDIDAATAGEAEIARLKERIRLEDEMLKKREASAKGVADSTRTEYQNRKRLYDQAILNIEARIAGERQLAAIESQSYEKAKNRSVLQKVGGFFTLEAASERNADRAAATSLRTNIIKKQVDDAASKPFLTSIKDLSSAVFNATKGFDELNRPLDASQKKMGPLNAAFTLTKGSALIAAQAIGTLASTIGNIFAIVGVGVAVFQILDSIFSSSAKESAKFSESVDSLGSSIKNVAATIETIENKDPLQRFSVESTQARANAMLDLNDTLSKVIRNFDKLQQSSNGWNRFWDTALRVVSFGNAGSMSSLRESFAGSVAAGIEAIPEGELRKQAEEKLKSILNISSNRLLNQENIDKAISGLSDKAAVQKIKEADTELRKFTTTFNNAAAAGTRYAESLKTTNKLLSESIAALRANDLSSKLGNELIDQSRALGDAIKDPVSQLDLLIKTASDLQSLSLLPPGTAVDLAKSKDQLLALGRAYADVSSQLRAREAELEQARLDSPAYLSETGQEDPNVSALQNVVLALRKAQEEYVKKIGEETPKLAKVATDKFIAGSKLLLESLTQAQRAAGLDVSKARLASFQGAGGSDAATEIKLRSEAIAIEQDAIESRYRNVIALERLTAAVNLATAQEELSKDPTNAAKQEAVNTAQIIKSVVTDFSKTQIIELFKKLSNNKSALDSNPALANALKALAPTIGAAIGSLKETAKLRGQRQILNEVETPGLRRAEALGDEQKRAAVTQKVNDALLVRIGLQEEISGRLSEQLVRERALAESRNATQRADLELLELENRKKTLMESTGIEASRKQFELEVLNALIDSTKKLRIEEEKSRNVKAQLAELNVGVSRTLLESQRKLELESASRALQEQLLTIEEQRLGVLTSLGDRSADVANDQLALVREQLSAESQLASLRQARDEKLLPKQAQLEVAKKNDLPTTELDAEIAFIQKKYAAEEAAILRINALKQQQINKTIEYKSALSSIAIVSEGIAAVFGKVGQSLGEVATAILNVATVNKEYSAQAIANSERQTKAQTALIDAMMGGGDLAKAEKEVNASREEGVKIQKRNINAQLDGYSTILGAIKRNASEQSRTAQAVSKIEKAIHIAKLAMWAKEQIAAIATAGTTVAAEAAKATASGTSAIAAAFAAPFPVGFVAGAAMIAIISSLLGGRIKKPSAGFGAADQQAVQGTGQEYVDGRLVSRAGGALGDPTAKASSLSKGIEKIEEHSFETMEYSNKMLDALKGIRKNTEGLSAILLEAGFNIRGLSGGQDKQVTSAGRTRDFSLQGNALIAAFGKDSGIGKKLGEINAKIFGGKTTRELQDAGIAVSGLIGALAAGGNGLATVYQNVKTTVDGGWFRSDKTSFETISTPLERSASEAIGNVFQGIIDTVKEAGSVLGKDPGAVSAMIEGFNVVFKTSFKDLKPEELTEALNAEFSVTFNQLAERVLPEFQKFRKPAEEYGDTIIRLSRNVQVSSLALEAAGLTFGDISSKLQTITAPEGFVGPFRAVESIQEATVRITESMIELAGGLDAFVEKTAFFAENFLTEAERLAPVQKRVTEEMSRLGLASVDTREEFAAVVKSLDLGSVAGQQLFNDLMNVAKGFAEVYPETRKVLKEEERLASLREQQIQIMKLEGRTAEATMLAREREIAELDSSLRAGQLYLYALQDELDLKAQLKTAYDREASVIKTTISNLTGYIKSLENFKTSLVTGNLSNLTATEKYAELTRQTQETIALITKTPVNDAERTARAEAINKLPEIGNSFLEASRTLFASSDKYNEDFSVIQQVLRQASETLATEKSTADLQLEALETNTNILTVIKENTKTTAEILLSLKTAQETTATTGALAKAGGLDVTGTTNVVGEPKDITTLFAGFVETFKANLDQQKTVNAIEVLTQEVVKLREELLEVTTNATLATVASNDANATTISDAITDAITQQEFDSIRTIPTKYNTVQA